MGKKLLLPGLALALGIGGFALRRLELATAFEPSGLPIPGAPASLALTALALLGALLLGLLAWGLCRGAAGMAYGPAFRICCPVHLTAGVLSALLLLGGGGLGIYNYVNRSEARLSFLLVAVLALAAGACIFLTCRKSYRDSGLGKYNGLLLVPAFWACLWLVAVYQTRAGDPVLQDYVYQILAIITTLLALYLVASFSFEKGRPALTLWACSLAVTFSCITLADGQDWMSLCLHLFSILWAGSNAALLMCNLTAEKEEPTHE